MKDALTESGGRLRTHREQFIKWTAEGMVKSVSA